MVRAYQARRLVNGTLQQPKWGVQRVLVVDDDLLGRKKTAFAFAVVRFLQSRGFDVEHSGERHDAETKIREAAMSGKPFDLVISDLQLVFESGYDVLRCARETVPATMTVIMSSMVTTSTVSDPLSNARLEKKMDIVESLMCLLDIIFTLERIHMFGHREPISETIH